MFRPAYEKSNPFHPSGCVSEDADLIVRRWRERRLSGLYRVLDDTETKQDDTDSDEVKTVNGQNYSISSESNNLNTINLHKSEKTPKSEVKPKKFQLPPCCCVM
jgi:hypothetical protein